MPIKIPDALPASAILLQENIACIESTQAEVQDIRALRILILNLMPLKIETEIHLLRMLSNSPLQVQIELLRIDDRASKNTPTDHMVSFYQSFEAIKHNKYDGMIITGAPLGQMAFEDVIFWPKLQAILDWTETNVTSTMFLCWAVQAAMFHFYGVDKRLLPQKLTGVYPHEVIRPQSPIARGFDDYFEAPHSRYAEVPVADIQAQPELHIIAQSERAGAYLFAHETGKHLFVTGHSEYEPDSLKNEYLRDLDAGLSPSIPEHYFVNDDPDQSVKVTWKSHGSLLFANWLNYYVYQLSPFDLSKIGIQRLVPPVALV